MPGSCTTWTLEIGNWTLDIGYWTFIFTRQLSIYDEPGQSKLKRILFPQMPGNCTTWTLDIGHWILSGAGVSSFVYQLTPDWPSRRDKLSQCADAKQAHHLDIGYWIFDIPFCLRVSLPPNLACLHSFGPQGCSPT